MSYVLFTHLYNRCEDFAALEEAAIRSKCAIALDGWKWDQNSLSYLDPSGQPHWEPNWGVSFLPDYLNDSAALERILQRAQRLRQFPRTQEHVAKLAGTSIEQLSKRQQCEAMLYAVYNAEAGHAIQHGPKGAEMDWSVLKMIEDELRTH